MSVHPDTIKAMLMPGISTASWDHIGVQGPWYHGHPADLIALSCHLGAMVMSELGLLPEAINWGCGPMTTRVCIDIHGSSHCWGLCRCPGFGQSPVTMLVSEGHARARATLTEWLLLPPGPLWHLARAAPKGHIWVHSPSAVGPCIGVHGLCCHVTTRDHRNNAGWNLRADQSCAELCTAVHSWNRASPALGQQDTAAWELHPHYHTHPSTLGRDGPITHPG